MAGPSDAERIDALARTVELLTQRMVALESRLGALPSPAPTPASAPDPVASVSHARRDGSQPRPEWWQVGPLQDVGRERLPVVALATAGGLALMFGLLFFVWYAVDQGWLAPALRVAIGGLAGVGLMAAAWSLAPRHRCVAGALGGAGLGSWFASWLVARHVHAMVGHTEAFVALALGAAACLIIAGQRRLRSMAFLAGLAAYVTPVATSTGVDRLHELMVYQVVLMGALWGLEQARKWPELVMLALVGTWTIMLDWAGEHLPARGGGHLLPWCAAVLALGSFQALQASARKETLTAALRYGVGGVFAWIAVTWAAAPNDDWLTMTTAVMALWHFAMMGWVWRRQTPRGVVAVALTLGWLQAFEFGPLALGDDTLGFYWLAQAWVSVVLFARRPGWGPVRMWLAPGLGAAAWAASYSRPELALPVALAIAIGLLVMAAWPKELEPAVESEGGLRPQGQRALTWVTAASGIAMLLTLGQHQLDELGLVEWTGPLYVAAVLLWVGWTAHRSTPAGVQVALGALAFGVVGGLVKAIDHEFFSLLGPLHGDRVLAEVAQAGLFAGAGAVVIALRRRRAATTATHTWWLHDAAGIVAAAALGLFAMLEWTDVVQALAPELLAAASLLQAGWSVVLAAVSLALVVLGLRLQRARWRRLGIGALFGVAAKVVFVDLGQVDLSWRVVSFLGLGVCLIAGAWAYGRFDKRMAVRRTVGGQS